ncbi:MAG: porin family protein [Chitinophagales bacterium]
MKKKLTLLLLGLTAMVTTQAQMGMHIGFHGQFNSIWIINQNSYTFSKMDYDYKYGALGGIALGYNYEQNFGVQVELNFAFMGQDYSDIIRDFSNAVNPDNPNQVYPVLTYRTVDLTYLQLPIMFKYMEGEKKDAIKYHMLGGIQFSALLGADQNYSADINDNEQIVQIPQSAAPQSGVPAFANAGGIIAETDYFKKLDVGVIFDIGVDMYVNDKTYFTAALRGHYGLLDINANDTRDLNPAKGENIYRSSHNAFVGINIGLHFLLPDVVIGGSK